MYRKYGTKKGGIIAIVALFFGLLLFGVLWVVNNQLQDAEIDRVIKSKGGTVISINKVELESSPFILTMNSQVGKRRQYPNTFYKVVFIKEGKEQVAWYRGVNGLFTIHGQTRDYNGNTIEETMDNKDIIRDYGDRWIFD